MKKQIGAIFYSSIIAKVLMSQILFILIISIGFFWLGNQAKMFSSFIGGMAAVIPNSYLALKVVQTSNQDAQKIVNAFYLGEVGKLLLTGLLFYLIFQIPNIELLPLLAGYTAALSVFWFALLIRN